MAETLVAAGDGGNRDDWTKWGIEVGQPAGNVYGVRGVGRMVVGAGLNGAFADDFRTERVMPVRLPGPVDIGRAIMHRI